MRKSGSALMTTRGEQWISEWNVLVSKSSMPQGTIQAYRETEFRVFSDAPLTLRIAERNGALLGLYKDHRYDSCAFVTACNPLGQLYDAAENARLQDQLANELKFRSLNFIAGEGKHPGGDWLGEPSFLVFGLSLESTRALGKMLDQNAIVWCGADAVPKLILLR